MSCGCYMNMEIIALDIAKEHISKMEDNILDDECKEFLDLKKLENNIKNGFVAITQFKVFIESLLNTIINLKSEVVSLDIDNIFEKMKYVCSIYDKDYVIIVKTKLWKNFREINTLRNNMIHYKNSFIYDGTAIYDFEIGTVKVKDYFTKSNFENLYTSVIKLGNLIAKTLNLTVRNHISVFECDGKDGVIGYIH